jgi:hypothetical protein
LKRRQEGGDTSLRLRITLDVRQEQSYSPHAVGLLRTRGEPRGEKATGNAADECSTIHYRITSSTNGSPAILRFPGGIHPAGGWPVPADKPRSMTAMERNALRPQLAECSPPCRMGTPLPAGSRQLV